MEELKLIMQTLAGLGETAKEGFIWWLVIDKLIPSFLLTGLGAGVIGTLAFAVKRINDTSRAEVELRREQDEAIKAVATIRGILGVYAYPALNQDCIIYNSKEYKDTIDAVRAVKSAAERNARGMA